MDSEKLSLEIRTLTIFSDLLSNDTVRRLVNLLDQDPQNTKSYISAYCSFVASLYKSSSDFSKFLYTLVMNDENAYIRNVAHEKRPPKVLEKALERELEFLQELSQITSEGLTENLKFDGKLPEWDNTQLDFKKDYAERIKQLPYKGYGVFAKYRAFGIKDNHLVPIKNPDNQHLAELIGYERERELVIKNTAAFVKGMKANNVLLYGDAGTGKSSTVKAVANEYAGQGLRMIEVKKHQLSILPEIIEQLATNPLKFIVFIDDLSFNGNDDNFIALKNILEGGINNTKGNILVYATSNRRHLVKEDMRDRGGDELYANDTIQETMSLAARFGLTITFQKPMKDLYIRIVEDLAKRYSLDMDENELIVKAEAFAIRNNGRSPRTAKQFIEMEKINSTVK